MKAFNAGKLRSAKAEILSGHGIDFRRVPFFPIFSTSLVEGGARVVGDGSELFRRGLQCSFLLFSVETALVEGVEAEVWVNAEGSNLWVHGNV